MSARLTTGGPAAKKRAETLRGNLQLMPASALRDRLTARLVVLESEAASAPAPAIDDAPPNESEVARAGALARQYDVGWSDGWNDAIAFVRGELIKPSEAREIWLPEFRPSTSQRRRGAA